MGLIAKKGSIVFCNDCKTDLYKLLKDVYDDTRLEISCVKTLKNIPKPISNSKTLCPICGKNWFDRKLSIKYKNKIIRLNGKELK
jgi:hypothetical protein